ncbi:MAG: SRPBCC family protein [Kordiimonadaceae bacterium]|nr:SRPBCC family protein [Kordiimonadaceae bacterium]
MQAKDKFRDWNYYHKAMVIFLASCIFWVVAWAVLVYEGAFQLEHQLTISRGTEAIWPWVVADENRPRWTGELVNLSPFDGEAGAQNATRLLFWRRGFERWQAVERVTSVVPERLLVTAQDSDQDQRWFTVELDPVDGCTTQVTLTETIRPLIYEERFWFFLNRSEREERLEISLASLDQWVKDTTKPCALE